MIRKCSKCHVEKSVSEYYKKMKRCKECIRAQSKKWFNSKGEGYRKIRNDQSTAIHKREYLILREEFFSIHGYRCSCCGDAHKEFLTIEHLNRGGKIHRAKYRNYLCMLKDMKKRGWQKNEYILLCMNCNWVERNGSTCPHKLERAHG